MPRPPAKKSLRFPFAGVVKKRGFRNAPQSPPYPCIDAVNVRGQDVAGRDLGASRPGLSKVVSNSFGSITAMSTLTVVNQNGEREYYLVVVGNGVFHLIKGSVVTSTTAELLTDTSLVIQVEDGSSIVFESTVPETNPIGHTSAYSVAPYNGRLLLADSVLREYNAITGVVVPVRSPASSETATTPSAPENQPLVCVYRDRVFLTGENHLWYASRQGSHYDWNFGDDMEDTGRAVAGQLSFSGKIGDTPIALIPLDDQNLVFACSNSLWVLQGDPGEGNIRRISSEIGIVSPTAWAKNGEGTMLFLSNDGLYIWKAGSRQVPERFSEERLPGILRNPDIEKKILMAYDPVGRGFHLFITPSTGNGLHFWLTLSPPAIWPVKFGDEGHQPVCVARLEQGGLAEIVLGCADGHLRKFNPASIADDGTTLNSHVLIGPVFLAPDDTRDALFNEIHGILLSGNVVWRLFVDSTAEGVANKAQLALNEIVAGETPSAVAASGAWSAGRNDVERPRARGSWVVVLLSSNVRWVYEAVAITALQLGRARW